VGSRACGGGTRCVPSSNTLLELLVTSIGGPGVDDFPRGDNRLLPMDVRGKILSPTEHEAAWDRIDSTCTLSRV
jgi:hypothetical protein